MLLRLLGWFLFLTPFVVFIVFLGKTAGIKKVITLVVLSVTVTTMLYWGITLVTMP